jgi:hypothetical protein
MVSFLCFIFLAASLSSSAASSSLTAQSLVGVWGCQSVAGGAFTGRSCHTWPQLSLGSDGTYTSGSEQGTWELKQGVLRLSGRTGTGHINEDGRLVVEYEAKGTRYREVLFKR